VLQLISITSLPSAITSTLYGQLLMMLPKTTISLVLIHLAHLYIIYQLATHTHSLEITKSRMLLETLLSDSITLETHGLKMFTLDLGTIMMPNGLIFTEAKSLTTRMSMMVVSSFPKQTSSELSTISKSPMSLTHGSTPSMRSKMTQLVPSELSLSPPLELKNYTSLLTSMTPECIQLAANQPTLQVLFPSIKVQPS